MFLVDSNILILLFEYSAIESKEYLKHVYNNNDIVIVLESIKTLSNSELFIPMYILVETELVLRNRIIKRMIEHSSSTGSISNLKTLYQNKVKIFIERIPTSFSIHYPAEDVMSNGVQYYSRFYFKNSLPDSLLLADAQANSMTIISIDKKLCSTARLFDLQIFPSSQ